MTALTVGSVSGLSSKAATPRKNIFARAWDAFVEGRMRQAQREIAMHRHLIPAALEQAGDRLVRNDKDLPFAA